MPDAIDDSGSILQMHRDLTPAPCATTPLSCPRNLPPKPQDTLHNIQSCFRLTLLLQVVRAALGTVEALCGLLLQFCTSSITVPGLLCWRAGLMKYADAVETYLRCRNTRLVLLMLGL
jgi:hypothetical protein